MRPLLFLGSGISRPSGLPDVQALTTAIFENRWVKQGDSNFYPAPKPPSQCSETQRCQEFLSRILKRVTPYYKNQRGSDPNYEDLVFLVEQLQYDELAWDDNAAVHPFRNEVKRSSADLSRSPNGIDSKYWFQNLTSLCLDFVQCVVWHELRSSKSPTGFDLLYELAYLREEEPLTICTINHDLLIERALTNAGFEYVDGFGAAEAGIRFFNHLNFRNNTHRPRILKLHGSINWFRFRPDDGDFHDDRYGIPVGSHSHWHNHTIDGRRLTALDAHPYFLTGSYNKIARYGAGIFLAQMNEFDRALDLHQTIVMSGYGWGDKGINMRLKNWLWGRRDRKIVLLYENLDSLKQSKALFFQFDKLIEKQMLIPVGKWFCDSRLADVTSRIATNTVAAQASVSLPQAVAQL